MPAEASTLTDLTINITRSFAAPRDAVFAAWIDPELLKRWFASPTPEHAMIEAEFDVRVGGRYRFGVLCPYNRVFYERGRYHEIDAPERLVLTVDWEHIKMEETLLTVDFHERPDGTEVVICESGMPSQNMLNSVTWAWHGCLDRLEELLAEPRA
jgi:uncharacterized protein YndB with AHSA1/START domain